MNSIAQQLNTQLPLIAVGFVLLVVVVVIIVTLFGNKGETTPPADDSGALASTSGTSGTRGDIAAGPLPDTSPTKKNGKVCEGKKAELVCQGTKLIRVTKAKYWRSPNSTCAAPGGICGGLNVLTKVSQECNGKKQCSFTVDNKKWGDACHGIVKEFEWEYVCA